MHAAEQPQAVSGEDHRPASPEQRSKALAITLPTPPSPFGSYLQDVFGKDRSPCRLVFGVASLPRGTPVELELILEVSA